MAIWMEYFENAHISCLHYMVNRKLHWSERLFWLVVVIICMGGTYYAISQSINSYSDQKATFRVDMNYLDWDTPFPSVVICEKNGQTRAMENKAKELFGLNVLYTNDTVQNALEMAFYSPPRFGNQFVLCSTKPENCLHGNFSYYANKFRSNCTELLAYCAFGRKNFTCCEEFLPVDTLYGTCFAFNNFGGRFENGSRVKNLQWKISKRQTNLTIEAKKQYLVVSVMSSNAVPTIKNTYLDIADSRFTSFVANSIYDIFMKVEETVTMDSGRLLSIEHRECRFPEENNLKHFSFYSQSNCEIECYITAQKKFCGCVAHTLPKIEPNEQCNLTGLLCSNLNKDINNYMIYHCRCLPDCNNTDVYKVGYLDQKAEKSRRIWNAKSAVVRFNIMIPIPTLRYIRYNVTSKLDLIVIIGGAVGFFLGCSFLSFAQIFYYFFVRSVTDELRYIRKQKLDEKNIKIDGNFKTSNMKLKLREVEKQIWEDLRNKKEVCESDDLPFIQ